MLKLCTLISCGFFIILAKCIDMEVALVAINSSLVIATTAEEFMVWQYKTPRGMRVTSYKILIKQFIID